MAQLALLASLLLDGANSWSDHFREVIREPNIAFGLLVGGLASIYAEFCSPGRIIPGVLGATSTALALWAFASLGLTWTGCLLLLLSQAFFVIESRNSKHGFFVTAGAVLMVVGSSRLIAHPGAGIRTWVAVGLSLPFAVLSSFLFALARRARQNKQFPFGK